MTLDIGRQIKGRLAVAGITQLRLARQIRVSTGALNHWLNGVTPPPTDFAKRANAAIDRLEAAERAADEARQRVLAESYRGRQDGL